MNNHIKQLAEQAGFETWQDEPWNPGDVIDWSSRYDDELVNFANLLINECATIIQQKLHEYDNISRPDIIVETILKNHFGNINETNS